MLLYYSDKLHSSWAIFDVLILCPTLGCCCTYGSQQKKEKNKSKENLL